MSDSGPPPREQPGPPPREQPAPGTEVVPRQAAAVILLRGGARSLRVLLVQRTPHARFMGGAWVFPGGALDRAHDRGDDPHRAAALRELREEAGVVVGDATRLIAFSRWITPTGVQIRYDTRFYLAELPARQRPVVDGQECVDLRWYAPADALAARETGEIMLVFPTIKHLEQLAAFASVRALLAHARGRDVVPVQPRVVRAPRPALATGVVDPEGGEVARLVLPGEPGYDDAPV